MSVCTQCGHELGVGRFCVNCGHPVGAPPTEDDWRTGTAERPVAAVPHGPRYPLYADEAATSTGSHRRVGPARGASWLPWVLAAAVLVLVAGLGTALLLSGDDDPAPGNTERTASDTRSPSESTEPTAEESPGPDDGESADAGGPEDVSRTATVTVPATAPPNQDVDGNLVRYEGRNMLDGVPETAWRMPGDGSGETLILALAEPVTLTSVGLVNGYAKTATDGGATFDWYAGNRRVLAVEWVFDDGTVVRQDLARTRELQTVDLEPVTTQRVELRLVSVSSPGTGPSARNFTAISEVSLVGTPA